MRWPKKYVVLDPVPAQSATADEEKIASLRQAVSRCDGQIASLKQSVTRCDGKIVSLKQDVAGRDAQIVSLMQDITGRDAQVVSLRQDVAGRDVQLRSLQERYDQLAHNHHDLDALYKKTLNSWSWRITYPLRVVLGFVLMTVQKARSRALSWPRMRGHIDEQ